MVISLIGSLIKQSKYSSQDVCEEFSISRNTLSNWCTGKTYPSVPQLFKLAALLGVKVDDLYKFKGDLEK